MAVDKKIYIAIGIIAIILLVLIPYYPAYLLGSPGAEFGPGTYVVDTDIPEGKYNYTGNQSIEINKDNDLWNDWVFNSGDVITVPANSQLTYEGESDGIGNGPFITNILFNAILRAILIISALGLTYYIENKFKEISEDLAILYIFADIYLVYLLIIHVIGIFNLTFILLPFAVLIALFIIAEKIL